MVTGTLDERLKDIVAAIAAAETLEGLAAVERRYDDAPFNQGTEVGRVLQDALVILVHNRAMDIVKPIVGLEIVNGSR